jgi:hypothetical protein
MAEDKSTGGEKVRAENQPPPQPATDVASSPFPKSRLRTELSSITTQATLISTFCALVSIGLFIYSLHQSNMVTQVKQDLEKRIKLEGNERRMEVQDLQANYRVENLEHQHLRKVIVAIDCRQRNLVVDQISGDCGGPIAARAATPPHK